MKVLIKLGGSLLDDAVLCASIAAQIAALPAGVSAVIVHGGGKQMTRYLAARGVESSFMDGLRVTTPEVVDALLKVYAGSVNKQLVGVLLAAGAPAVGISGIDGGLAVARPLNPALGAVGRVTHANGRLLDVLVGGGFLPVVACVAGGEQGEVFNVNADQMAVACAWAWKAQKLLFLTDIAGVKGAGGELIPRLTPSQARTLVETGIASGGMQAKLEAACDALERGLREVRIAAGAEPEVLARLLSARQEAAPGTALVPEEGA
ncbi:MAG: acetylglutamate kinase [Bryobacteraceae bacterium]